MIQVNLLPIEEKEKTKNKLIEQLMISISFIVAALFLSGAVFLFIFTNFVQKNHIDNLRSDTEAALNEIRSTPETGKLLTIQNQLQTLPELHAIKPLTSRMFTYLTKIIPDNVQLTNLTMKLSTEEATNNISLTGLTDDFKSTNIFIDILKNATFSSTLNLKDALDLEEGNVTTEQKIAFNRVIFKSGTKDDDQGLRFQIDMSYNPEIFDYAAETVAFKVPTAETTISRTERPQIDSSQEELFTDDPLNEDAEDANLEEEGN